MSSEWEPQPSPTDEQQRLLRDATPETLAEILGGKEEPVDEGLQLHDLPEGQGVRVGRHQILSPLRSLVRRVQEGTEPDDNQQEPGILDPVALALLTRRDVLQKGSIAAVGLGALLAGIGIGRGTENVDPVEAMRSDLEKKFNVRLTTKNGATWSLENLTVVAQVLDVLPSQWFHPPSGEVMEIAENAGEYEPDTLPGNALPDYKAMLYVFANHQGDQASYDTENYFSEQLIEDLARISIPRMSTHEQTGMEPWFHAVDEVLGMPFQQFALQKFVPSIREKYLPVLKKVEDAIARTRQEEYRATFSIDLLGAFLQTSFPRENQKIDSPRSLPYPNKFLPTLALHFIRGKAYFLDMYTEMFGDKMANRLYNFARDSIYRGRTYDMYPLVSPDPYYSGPDILMPTFQLQDYGLE